MATTGQSENEPGCMPATITPRIEGLPLDLQLSRQRRLRAGGTIVRPGRLADGRGARKLG